MLEKFIDPQKGKSKVTLMFQIGVFLVTHAELTLLIALKGCPILLSYQIMLLK